MLADAGSPLRRFLAVELPEMAAMRADCRARLPLDPAVRKPTPPPGVRPALGTLGAAIDHRLRLALSDRAPLRGTVRAGVALVAGSAGSARIGTALQLAGRLAEGDELRGIERRAEHGLGELTQLRPALGAAAERRRRRHRRDRPQRPLHSGHPDVEAAASIGTRRNRYQRRRPVISATCSPVTRIPTGPQQEAAVLFVIQQAELFAGNDAG